MKKLTLLTILVFSAFSLVAQVKQPDYVGDTLGPWSVISFETPSEYLHINPTAQNIWQVGIPGKSIFNQAWSLPKAMVTDTLNFYPDNNQSSFEISIGQFNTNWMFPYDLFIDFRHKFDSDTLRDGGYISVSWDHRQTWTNILDDTVPNQFLFVTPARNGYFYGNTNLYSASDSLFNGEHGFSGKSNGWIHSCMAWYTLPVNRPASFPPDTMFLRFNFISDNIHHNREGWMIDEIRIFSIDLGSGLFDASAGNMKALVVPNPVKDQAAVYLDKSYKNVHYRLIDISGRVAAQGNPGDCREFYFDRNHLAAGFYLMEITTEQGVSGTQRITVLD
ncbi:MAG: T9SS type A sorting domain-containing protein [Bacteroidota bacterium]